NLNGSHRCVEMRCRLAGRTLRRKSSGRCWKTTFRRWCSIRNSAKPSRKQQRGRRERTVPVGRCDFGVSSRRRIQWGRPAANELGGGRRKGRCGGLRRGCGVLDAVRGWFSALCAGGGQ